MRCELIKIPLIDQNNILDRIDTFTRETGATLCKITLDYEHNEVQVMLDIDGIDVWYKCCKKENKKQIYLLNKEENETT